MAGIKLPGGVPPVVRISVSLVERFLSLGENRLA
jgi:hypothetical protein